VQTDSVVPYPRLLYQPIAAERTAREAPAGAV